jgi:hypothetical protein
VLQIVTPATSDLLTTLDKVKAELGLPPDPGPQDAYLTDQIAYASAAITEYCGRYTFGRQELLQTEMPLHGEYWRRWNGALVLDEDLEPTIATVMRDDVELAAGTDYVLDGYILHRVSPVGGTMWWTLPDAFGCYATKITVAYSAGFNLPDAAPLVLQRACILTAATSYAARGRDRSIRSESYTPVGATSYRDPGGGSGSNAMPSASALPAEVIGLITRYERRVVR